MSADDATTRLLSGFVRPWVLLAIRARPAHGYELIERLRELGLPPDGGGLYRYLNQLEADGLVRSDWEAPAGVGPRRRVYRVTRKGTRQIHRDAATVRLLGEAIGAYTEDYDKVRETLDRRRSKRDGG